MSNFLIDEDLPHTLSSRLRQGGHESRHIAELGMRGLPDSGVFRLAQERGEVLISRDLGFANTLQYPLGTHQGLVVVRYPSKIPVDLLIKEIVESLAKLDEREFAGALIIIEPDRIRIRRTGN